MSRLFVKACVSGNKTSDLFERLLLSGGGGGQPLTIKTNYVCLCLFRPFFIENLNTPKNKIKIIRLTVSVRRNVGIKLGRNPEYKCLAQLVILKTLGNPIFSLFYFRYVLKQTKITNTLEKIIK